MKDITFSAFANALYSYCGRGEAYEKYVLNLVDNIMENPDSDASHNPLAAVTPSMRNKIYNGSRTIIPKNASIILSSIDKGKFIDFIDKLTIDALKGLCANLANISVSATPQNVGVVCADMFEGILMDCANVGSKKMPSQKTDTETSCEILIDTKKNNKAVQGDEISSNTMVKKEEQGLPKTLFISYCHKDQAIVEIVEKAIRSRFSNNVRISTYSDVQYRRSFKEFMQSIKEHDFVLSIVSDNYLKSKACMYEIGEIIHTEAFKEKMLFVLISEKERKFYAHESGDIAANVYLHSERIRYVEYWDNECKRIEGELAKITRESARTQLYKHLSEVHKIIDNDLIPFLEFLADTNGLTFEQLYSNNFGEIIGQIEPSAKKIKLPYNFRTPLNDSRLPFIFVVDTSGSMHGERIGIINNALESWIDKLSDVSSATISLAVISFNTVASLVQDFTEINRSTIRLPRLQAQGMSSLGEAIMISLDTLREYQRTINRMGPCA